MAKTVLRLLETPRAANNFESLADQLPPGRLIELSGRGHCARTSTAVALLRHAQREGETAVWIQPRGGELFPPDLHECGIDLSALVVIHIPLVASRHAACRAAEILLRSGSFGFLVLDLSAGPPPGPPAAWQGRLLGLARQHQSRVLLLTRSRGDEASLGPLIGLRIESKRIRESGIENPVRYRVEHGVLKNKSGAPFAVAPDIRLGPWGMG